MIQGLENWTENAQFLLLRLKTVLQDIKKCSLRKISIKILLPYNQIPQTIVDVNFQNMEYWLTLCKRWTEILIFCRYHYNVDGRRKHVLPQEGKFVLTQDQGLVIIGLADQDAGQYDCRVNHQTINSYR